MARRRSAHGGAKPSREAWWAASAPRDVRPIQPGVAVVAVDSRAVGRDAEFERGQRSCLARYPRSHLVHGDSVAAYVDALGLGDAGASEKPGAARKVHGAVFHHLVPEIGRDEDAVLQAG